MKPLTYDILISFSCSTIISLLLIPQIIRFSKKFNLVDKPDERKVHIIPIARLAGIAIFFASLFGVLFSNYGRAAISDLPIYFSAVAGMFLLGIWDDLKNISAKLRFLLQIGISLSIAFSGIRLTSLHGILGIQELSIFWQYLVSVLIIVGVTNAFNLIDGIDGLAGGLALISIVALAIVAYLLDFNSLLIVYIALAGALIGFLYDNFSPAKIFMGDGGSVMLGFFISSSGILLIETSLLHPGKVEPSRVALIVTALLIIPVFDTVRVFMGRMFKGISPFKADKTHIHHLFLIAGLNHRKTCYFLYSFAFLLLIISFFAPIHTYISITIFLMVFLFNIITEILRINQGVEKWLKIIHKMEKGEVL